MSEVELGKIVEDTVTGFKGRVTAICLYLSASTRIRVETLVEGEVKAEWFDEERLVERRP